MALTPTQVNALAAELKNDPEALGYAPYVAATDLDSLSAILNAVRDGVTPCSVNSVIGPSGTITGATNASPIVITSSAHGRTNGDSVVISGVGGNTAANNAPNASPPTVEAWVVGSATANTFALVGSTGNGAYTGGGTWNWVVEVVQQSVSAQDVLGAIRIQDLPGFNNTTTGVTQDSSCKMNFLTAICNQPSGKVNLVSSSGAENNIAKSLKQIVGGGATQSGINLSNLEQTNGSRAAQLFGVGTIITDQDVVNAINTGNA